MVTAVAIAIIVLAFYFLVRGLDVRLILFSAGVALGALALKPWLVFDSFERAMGDGKTIGPICSAMGYAFLLRATGCDREMVRVLIAPICRVRWLLIPGGCLIGFITNIAITSQTAAAAAVGSILIPLMLAARFHPVIAAGTLVLGCSGGGSLLNPGDADLVALQKFSGAPMKMAIESMFLPLLGGFGAAVVSFSLLSRRIPPMPEESVMNLVAESGSINYFKAWLPPLPVLLLFASMPQVGLIPPLLKLYPNGLPVPHAMLICAVLVLIVGGKEVSRLTREFFEGMGFAYVQVISLIITASCFIAGLRLVGLTEKLVHMVSSPGVAGLAASGFFPWLLAVICGSGIAPSVAFSETVLPTLSQTDLSGALNLGTFAALCANFGRTMSPVAAVVIFTTTLVKVTPLEIVKRTAAPLIIGMIVAGVVIATR